MTVKILGIAGSPISGGNCEKLVKVALEAAAETPGIKTDFINLADKKIDFCHNCQQCIKKRARCILKDDLTSVQDAMFASDALILGAPAYNGLISTQLINLFNRGREEIFFSHRMRYKIAASITLGWFGVGLDRALDCINQLILSWGMFPLNTSRGKALVSTVWKGERAAYMPNGVLDDQMGVRNVQDVGHRLAEATKMFKPGRDAWVAKLAKKSQAEGKKFIDGVWR